MIIWSYGSIRTYLGDVRYQLTSILEVELHTFPSSSELQQAKGVLQRQFEVEMDQNRPVNNTIKSLAIQARRYQISTMHTESQALQQLSFKETTFSWNQLKRSNLLYYARNYSLWRGKETREERLHESNLADPSSYSAQSQSIHLLQWTLSERREAGDLALVQNTNGHTARNHKHINSRESRDVKQMSNTSSAEKTENWEQVWAAISVDPI